jgi:hypothetical protein
MALVQVRRCVTMTWDMFWNGNTLSDALRPASQWCGTTKQIPMFSVVE